MTYQYTREPLLPEEADRLCGSCADSTERLVIWILLDTGLRVSELCDLNKEKYECPYYSTRDEVGPLVQTNKDKFS